MADFTDFIDKVKNAINIEDFVSEYVTLSRAGKNRKGLCPFHAEKTPSFTVYPDTTSFYCFGCQEAGDIIGFTMKIESLDFIEALEFLSHKTGIPLPKDNNVSDEGIKLRRRILEANREAARFFFSQTGNYQAASDYIEKRGLKPATIKHFGIGYAPDSWNALSDYLRAKGFSEDELIAAALVKKGERGGVYDIFRGRLIFPIIDTKGSVIGFGGRLLDYQKNPNGYTPPKYLNTSDTPVFKKSKGLYSLQNAKKSGEKAVILCEGYMDVVSLWQGGFQNTVATLGTAIGEEQALLLSRSFDEILVSYDNDEAGQKAAARAENICGNVGIKLKVLQMSGAKDPDEYIAKFGKEAFNSVIGKSLTVEEHRLTRAKTGLDMTSADGQAEYLRKAIGEIARIFDPIKRETYIAKTAKELGVKADILRTEVGKQVVIGSRVQAKKETQSVISRRPVVNMSEEERLRMQNKRLCDAAEGLIYFLFAAADYGEYIFTAVDNELIPTEKYKHIYDAFYAKFVAGESTEISAFNGVIAADEVSLLAAIVARCRDLPLSRDVLDDFIKAVKAPRAASRQDFGAMSLEDLARLGAEKLKNEEE
jgi:DNA primase, catalytic core